MSGSKVELTVSSDELRGLTGTAEFELQKDRFFEIPVTYDLAWE